MNPSENSKITRRELGKRVGQVAAVTAMSGVAIPHVYAAGEQTIQVVLVGCGGRGTGAAGDALRAKGANLKLIAMADAYPDRLASSFNSLSHTHDLQGKIDVPEERKFIGYDAYKKAMDCLKPGDVAIFATPLAFR